MTFEPLGWIEDELGSLEEQSLLRRLSIRQGAQRADAINLDGEFLANFSSNDYLGLASDGRLAAAAIEGIKQTNWGSGASPLVTGRGVLHARLEEALARFEGTEAALLFPSGFAANVGAITSLAGQGDVVFSDAKNHASIIDGCRLSGAEVIVYPHCDAAALAGLLGKCAAARRILIVTDGLFSMDGDLAPLEALADLAQRHDAMLMVDEAHATGVFGERGRGVCEHLGVEQSAALRVGTLSKALGSIGGFVVGDRRLIDYLANRARTYVFSTAPPEAIAAVGIQALQIVQEEPRRRRELLQRAALLRDRLREQGWSLGGSASQIIPVVIGQAEQTIGIAHALREQGLFAPGIRPPSVPQGESLLRISLSWSHSQEMIDRLVDALGQSRSLLS